MLQRRPLQPGHKFMGKNHKYLSQVAWSSWGFYWGLALLLARDYQESDYRIEMGGELSLKWPHPSSPSGPMNSLQDVPGCSLPNHANWRPFSCSRPSSWNWKQFFPSRPQQQQTVSDSFWLNWVVVCVSQANRSCRLHQRSIHWKTHNFATTSWMLGCVLWFATWIVGLLSVTWVRRLILLGHLS